MVDIELLKRLAEACDIERCADEEERDRNLNEFYSVLEPEDVAALIAENERLRQIISDSATACGAAMSAECTVEFMGHLPAEIAGVLGQFCAELERVKAEGLALLVNARPFLASRLTELPSIREQVENPEAVDRAVEKLSALVSHIDAAVGKGGRADA